MRLEVVGALWGTGDMRESARVVDISPAGALIASPVAVAPESLRPLALRIGDSEVSIDVRVRHLRPLPATEEEPARFLLGVEFLGTGVLPGGSA